jgi:UDP-glucose 4-epimerase
MAAPAAVGGVFNIGSDRPVSILELAQRVVAVVCGQCETASGKSAASNPQSPIPHPPSCSTAGTQAPIPIVFQTYAEAYGDDFEDCRRRVPDLSKLRNLTGLQARWGLDDIIAELARARGAK